MLILDRDRLIVMSIARFKQLSPGHLTVMHFHNLASPTPMYRALRRLKEYGYISPIERRMTGGTGAGSGQFVFQLGRAGHALSRREGKYWQMRSVDYHTLAIADVYVELLKLERAGRIRLDGFSTEPDSWIDVDGLILRPDLFVDVANPHRRKRYAMWLEIDMGTERPTQIKKKLDDYISAGKISDSRPLVIFIAPDDDRARELRWIIEHGYKDEQADFLVSTIPEFAGLDFF